MIIIDPDGLFHGNRLARCSDLAQLYYPRLLLASNGFGRIELDFDRIRYEAFPTIRVKPTDELLRKSFDEFSENFLLFVYRANEQVWGQWDVRSNWLPRYKNAIDRRSPSPDEETFKKWVLLGKSQRANDFGNFPKLSENFRPAVAVAVAGAECNPEVVVEPVETSENRTNEERTKIVERGQQRLLDLRKQRNESKRPTQIAEVIEFSKPRAG